MKQWFIWHKISATLNSYKCYSYWTFSRYFPSNPNIGVTQFGCVEMFDLINFLPRHQTYKIHTHKTNNYTAPRVIFSSKLWSHLCNEITEFLLMIQTALHLHNYMIIFVYLLFSPVYKILCSWKLGWKFLSSRCSTECHTK